MAVYVGADELSKIYVGNSNGNSIYLGDKKVWPNYPDLDPIVAQITKDLKIVPIHYCKFDGNITQTPLLIDGVQMSPINFISTPNSPTYEKGVGGRKALKCSYVDISLAQLAKAQHSVFISMLIKQTT